MSAAATVFDHEGALRLGQVLGRGRRGTVCTVAGRPDVVVKLYHERVLASPAGRRLLLKLTAMVNLSPPGREADGSRDDLAWPLELVFADVARTRPVGFSMPRAGAGARRGDHCLTLSQVMCVPTHLALVGSGTLLAISREVARVIAVVHAAGHAVPDVKPENFHIVLSADPVVPPRVTLLDCDSLDLSVNGVVMRGEETTELYCAPEVLTGELHTQRGDRFALAELICALSTLGQHPFAGVPVDPAQRGLPLIQRIVAGLSPLLGTSTTMSGSRLDCLAPSLARLAAQAFAPGDQDRPGPADWITAIDQLELVGCTDNHRHTFGRETGHCPWCAYVAAGGSELFPATTRRPAGRRIPDRDIGKGFRETLRGVR